MKELKRLALHLVLIVVAAGAALWKAGPEDPGSRKLEPGEVKLWGNNPSEVTKIVFSGLKKTVSLERRTDKAGDWFFGTEAAPLTPPPPEPEDAGAKSPHTPPPPTADPGDFVSVEVAQKLVEKIAPLIAKYRIGEVGDDRLEAFGLDKPKGTLSIEIAGKTQELVIGGPTPNRSQTYVRWLSDNLVYVIDGDITRDLESGKARLSERQQHNWKGIEPEKAVVLAGDHRYEVMRSGTEGRRFWAKPETPDTNDETVANWLKKVERLRPVKFIAALPEGAERIFRIEFSDKKDSVGFLELHTHKADDKREWYLVTENLRLPATVTATTADQARDDLDSLFPGAGYSEQHADEEVKDDKPEGGDPHGGDPHGGDPHGMPPPEEPKEKDGKEPPHDDAPKDPKGKDPKGKDAPKEAPKGAPKAPKEAPKTPPK